MYLNTLQNLAGDPRAILVGDGGTAAALARALDHQAMAAGSDSWQPRPVMTWQRWQALRFASDRLAGNPADAGFVLNHDQAQALWRSVIEADRQSAVSASERAAQLALDAWQLQYLYRLPPAHDELELSRDALAFRRWAAAYRERTARLEATDSARLLAAGASSAAVPDIIAQGLTDPAPLLESWLQAAALRPDPRPRSELARFECHAFVDREAELYAALAWAAEQAQRFPHERVVVALDSLQQDAALVRRCAEDVLGVASSADGPGFYTSARDSISAHPMMRLALLGLELSRVTRWDLLSELIRHPLLIGAEEERASRAAADVHLRSLDRHELPLALVRHELGQRGACPGVGHDSGAAPQELLLDR